MKPNKRKHTRGKPLYKNPPNKSDDGPPTQPQSSGSKTCYFCAGTWHPRDSCPAKEATCRKCAKIGHYDRACQSKQHSSQPSSQQCTRYYDNRKGRKINEVAEDFDSLFVGSIDSVSEHHDDKNVNEIIHSFRVTTQPYHQRYAD
jgi:hypothetical protein